LGQDPRWRSFLVSRIEAAPTDSVLDVACGTGAVALELVRRFGCEVTGVDQSPEMLEIARRRAGEQLVLLEARAEALPFADATYDGLTFTYLLRYVDDPATTLVELARVVRPGGCVAGLEFGVPDWPWRGPWEIWTRVGLPVAGLVIGRGWLEVGRFLGPSIREHWRRFPPERQLKLWRDAGLVDVHARRLTLGAAIVVWGRKP
jgi:demethylmenaquinone methyltransferase / 2-methoxy-6-polyprenyl-1,4-benzoquinol methylase